MVYNSKLVFKNFKRNFRHTCIALQYKATTCIPKNIDIFFRIYNTNIFPYQKIHLINFLSTHNIQYKSIKHFANNISLYTAVRV